MNATLPLLLALGLLATACTGTTDPDEGGTEDALTAKGPKAVREAIRTTCEGGLRFDFFFDKDAQLRGTLLGDVPVELGVVKEGDRLLDAIRSVGGDDTVLQSGAGGSFIIVSRFFPRFITSADPNFVNAHSSIKVVTMQGAVTEARCTPDKIENPSESVRKAHAQKSIAEIADLIAPGEYQGHGRTRAKLCSAIVEREASTGKLTVSIKPRNENGSLGATASSFILNDSSSILYDVVSAKKDVVFVHATTREGTKDSTRSLVIDNPDRKSKVRVTINSFGENGGSTNFCDMDP